MDPTTLGFDPKLAAHAAASLPVYAAAFTAAKRLDLSPRVQMLAATAVTAALNAAVALGGGTAPLIPALSTATVGAVGAMMAHAALFKRRGGE